ncbi:MAG TPA: CBS domain-containing protein [Baekduia sp.]|nr:CBS domain-containing protein [Baekduia sp.]
MPATVADIMDPDAPVVRESAPVEEVVEVFKETAVGGLPVVNEGGRCVGFITEDDLIIDDPSGDLHIPHYIELFGGLIFLESLKHYEDRVRKAAAYSARDLMSEDPVTVDAGASVREAAKIMSSKHHNRLPVTEHGRCIGLVTRADVLTALTAED